MLRLILKNLNVILIEGGNRQWDMIYLYIKFQQN